MNIKSIRNATLVIEYAGRTFLVDPMLAEQGSYAPFPNSARQDRKNPLVGLPIPIEEIVQGIDAVIVTHLHLDHWDDAAKAALPKDVKLFAQNEGDAAAIRDNGFTNVEILTESTTFKGISLIKTYGEHGRGDILNRTGLVCGVVFKHPDEKTLYVAGDTVWIEAVRRTLETHKPKTIVVNAGDNRFLQGGSLVMDRSDVHEVHRAAPEAQIVCVHMEAVNHWNLSRAELRTFAEEKGMSAFVNVPEDGESYSF
ncbi:MBL fold metallo-hydrolase [Saccharibacillus alkalitolerans]|uniref:MBL fold metallo-hydrolase n=1 Tax=Saccharibacillus alkalitolerans TaxID=2705290 RepID=A0ABX0F2W2_9BACL|nr:MBL fold metallo-hydrolase [Saccharibacillus alkalitolerans]NGZ74810.1 MBL fold metallo-hydrolase [Saccharibacillus alkalitolerans]